MLRLDLLPGTQCDVRIWSRLTACLPARVALHHVPLETASSRARMQVMIAELTAPRSHLVGFSMGGYLALEHALAHPERVASLTVIGASASGLGPDERSARTAILQHLARQRYGGMPPSRLAAFFHPVAMADEAALDLVRAMDRALGGDVLATQLRETMDRPDLRPRLAELRCPVLFVAGDADRIAPPGDLQAMQAACPGSRFLLLPQCGHMMPLERPRELAAALLAR